MNFDLFFFIPFPEKQTVTFLSIVKSRGSSGHNKHPRKLLEELKYVIL
jgi:hypothetical protein